MGSTFGRSFRLTTFGESHGRAVGAVVEGCPAGLELSEADIQRELDRRKPGQSSVTTPRREEDRVEILSGVFEGRTTGTPIAMVVFNRSFDSSPYERFRHVPRPGHADLSYHLKYGHWDYRGGGRASGRETLARVAGGAVAKKLLSTIGVEVLGHAVEIAGVRAKPVPLSRLRQAESTRVRCADLEAAKQMEERILEAKRSGDSVGGVVEVVALNVPPGLGEPVFDKLDADIAKAMMSIGAVKGVEIGAGFEAARLRGSENNDPIRLSGDRLILAGNRSGGVLGGISTGMPIVVRVAVKPTPSISAEQESVDLLERRGVRIKISGMHDPCIVPRVVPVCEAMLALTLADHAIRAGVIHPCRL